jgi:outer membrane receptor for ferrienterochelin and colicins
MKTRALLLNIVILLSVSPWVLAEQQDPNEQENFFEMSIEELMQQELVVHSASKYTQRVKSAPSSVTIITADEIHKYGFRTLADILNSVQGMYIAYDRNYHYIGVRGFRRPGDYDTRVLLLVDGHRVNGNVSDDPTFGTECIVDVDLIDRIEIIRGPGSALYGSNALLAVINVITKGAKQLRGLEVSGELASFDTQKGRVSYGNVFNNGVQLLVSASGYDSGGQQLYFKEFDDPATHNGLVKNDDDQFHNLFAKVSAGDFTLMAAHTAREKGVPTAPWDTVFGDPRTRTNDNTTLIGLTYEHNFADKSTVRGRVVYHQLDYDGVWPTDYAEEGQDPCIVLNGDSSRGRWWETELQYVCEPFERHKFAMGIEGRYSVRQDQRVWDEKEVFFDDHRHGKNWGIYFQDEFAAFENLHLVGGIRYDWYDTVGGTTNPRLAVIYNLSKNTTLKLLYGEAFRAPNAYELYYQDGGLTQKASMNLKPETMKTYEVVLEQNINQQLRATISGFSYVMKDVVGQYTDPGDGLLVFKNINEVEARGMEVGVEGRWENDLRTRCSYSFVDTENKGQDGELVNSPRHLVRMNVIVPVVKDKIFAGLTAQYNSKARTLAGNYADDFVVANLTLTWRELIKGVEARIGVYNLFDEKYGYPAFGEHAQDIIYQDGRTFGGSLTYRFK